MADIVTEIVVYFFEKINDPIALIGVLFVLIGCAIRTAAPFARKVWLGEFTWNEFNKTYIGLLIGAFGTSMVFYSAVAPVSANFLVEIILGLLLGIAGNEAWNEIYSYVKAYFSGKGSRA